MEFFGMGSLEILLIMLLALLLFGPGRLVEIARSLGKMVHNFRKVTSELTTQITREVDEQKEALTAPVKEAKSDITRMKQEFGEQSKSLVDSLETKISPDDITK